MRRISDTVDDIKYKTCMTLRTLNYGNDGIFLLMGHAGFLSRTDGFAVWVLVKILRAHFRSLRSYRAYGLSLQKGRLLVHHP